jgi:sugar phosphate isomerase/epimerase
MRTHSRRDFLKFTAAGTFGALLLQRCGSSATPIALQLYTIRDFMNTKDDVMASLKKLAEIGYKNLELAGYADGKFYQFEPKEFRKIVNDLGMEVLSSHTSVESSSEVADPKKVGDDHAIVGAKYAIQPWVNPPDRNIDFYQRMVQQMNQAGKVMKEVGIKFGYHNHNFEFASLDGKIPYFDIIMPGCDKDLVTMELDLFWTTKAGQDPVEIFKKYPGRFELLHCKDMFTKQDPFFDTVGVEDFAPVGAGVLDFKRIFAENKTSGAKWFVVEQDLTGGKPFEAVQTSITNLSKMV